MIYEVLFSEGEVELLGKLKGVELEAVTSDGWAYFLRTGAGVYRVTVVEEPTPDERHRRGDVTRPQIAIGKEPAEPRETSLNSPAQVEAVVVLRTVVTMSPPERIEGDTLRGVELPPHTAYGPIYIHPEDERLPALKKNAVSGDALSLTWLDIGFRMHLRNSEAVSVHTDGVTFFPTLSRGIELDGIPPGVIQEIAF